MGIPMADNTKPTLDPRFLRLPIYPTRSIYVELAFLAFVVARYIQLGARRDILATIRFEFLLGLVVIGLVGFQFMSRKPEIGRSRNLIIAACALVAAMIMQIPFAANPVLAKAVFNDRVIKFLFMTFFMIVMIESPKTMRWFIAVYLFSIFYVTLEAVQGLITGGLVWQNQGVMRLHGAVPMYAHPNSLSGVAMGAVPFIAFLFPVIKRKLIKLALLALLGTSLICVVYTGSRTGYIGLIAFVLWWWFQSRKKRRFMIRLLLIAAVMLPILPDQYIERFKSIGGEEKEGHSKDARIQILRDAVVVFTENPLGVGIASFPAVRMARFGRYQDTHNLYLEIATNLGIQGLIIFFVFISVMLALFRDATHALQTNRRRLRILMRDGRVPRGLYRRMLLHDSELAFLIAVAQASAGFIFVRLVLGLFGMDMYEVYWWFGVGICVAICGLIQSAKANTQAFLQSVESQ